MALRAETGRRVEYYYVNCVGVLLIIILMKFFRRGSTLQGIGADPIFLYAGQKQGHFKRTSKLYAVYNFSETALRTLCFMQ